MPREKKRSETTLLEKYMGLEAKCHVIERGLGNFICSENGDPLFYLVREAPFLHHFMMKHTKSKTICIWIVCVTNTER